MLARRIIPCLDVADGRVVKGVHFASLRDAGDPVAQAARYDAEGADELVFLDISASHESRETTLDMVSRVAETIFIPFTVGGGIRSVEDAGRALRAGADKIAVNTAAVRDPELVRRLSDSFGAQCVVAAVDVRRTGGRTDGGDSVVAQRGWNSPEFASRTSDRMTVRPSVAPSVPPSWRVHVTGGREATGLDALDWIARLEQLGAGEILLTSMDRDGTQTGYDLELLRAAADRVRIPVIASGGAGGLSDLADALEAGAHGVLAASIFHFEGCSLPEARSFLRQRGYPVRS
jgi:cyclase